MADEQNKQKQIIYVFQELYPKTRKVEGLGNVTIKNNFERFYGFQSEDTKLPEISESHRKSISDYLLLVSHIESKLHKNNCFIYDYELRNLSINGSDSLTSFEGSFKAYNQSVTILRLPLFEHEFKNVQEEFRKQVGLEKVTLSG